MSQNLQSNKNKYKYSSFNEITENQSDYNFYGIIYDASFPKYNEVKKSNNNYRFECTIKLIDKDINCISSKEHFENNIIHLTIKTYLKEQIPYIHTIGDIIRVQKGNYSNKIKRNIYLNFGNNSRCSWCIFSGAIKKTNEFAPLLCSSTNYYFEQQDELIIKEMRNFIKEYLIKENSIFYTYENKLSKRIIGVEQDVLIHVISKQELEDRMICEVEDETDICRLHTYKYFNFIEIGDVCRLRSYKCIDQNDIIMNEHSNLLKIPKFTNYYIEFIKRLNIKKNSELDINKNEKDTTALDIINNANLNGNYKIIESPKNILTYIENFKNYEIKHFDEIENENNFLLDVNIVKVEPENISDSILILCQKCNTSFNFFSEIKILDNNSNNFICPNCEENSQYKLYYNCILFAIENIYSNKILIIHLCTYDSQGENFFGIKPEEIVKDNKNNLILLQNRIKLLSQKDNFVRIYIEKIKTENSNNKNKNHLLRIIGNYTNI